MSEGKSGVEAKNRTGPGGGRSSDDTEQLGEFAVTNDNVLDVLLTVDGLARVHDTGNPSDENKLVITQLGSLVEITLWYHNYVNTWLLQSSSTQEITFPLNTAFTVTVYHYDKIGWLFCRHRTENSKYILSCNTLQGGSHASTGDVTIETLIDVSGLGKITDSTTDSHKLILTSYGSGVEWSYWDGDPHYNQGYISPYTQTTIDFEHYRSFIVTIYRSDMIGWMFCRENGNRLKCSTKQGGLSANTADTTEETLVNVPGLGKVTDSGVAQQPRVPQQVKIYSWTGVTLVYSIWYYNSYISGTISYPGWYTTVQVPWYKSFTMSIQSPSHEDARITWLFCRVNDRRLTCHTLSITTQKMNKLDWNGLDSNADTPDKTMDIDEAIFTDAGDKVTAKWWAPRLFYEVTVYVYCKDEGPANNGALKFYFDGDYVSTGYCSSGFNFLSFWDIWFSPQDAGFHTIQFREKHDNSIVRLKEGDSDPDPPGIDAVIYVESPGFVSEHFLMDEVEWRNMDSDDTSPHMEIGNYALFWHEGDDVRWNSIQISQDSIKIGVYCKSYTTNARLKLYISSSSKGTHTITQPNWDWFYFDRWDDVSGSFSIRLKHKEGGPYPDSDIGITDLRLIF
ncbi:MAG: hypothetical protein V3U09_05690 [Thermoplasmata archaeon]